MSRCAKRELIEFLHKHVTLPQKLHISFLEYFAQKYRKFNIYCATIKINILRISNTCFCAKCQQINLYRGIFETEYFAQKCFKLTYITHFLKQNNMRKNILN
jgi:hypothetical protein